ncbi:hypothetical protein FJU30_15290 [Affinibrenneria salicis]|uniref:HEAT repeat domain-containing protein n=1 Tax=Affinibrenneria salicis TaxID=2590031 RepID=A0A5J5FY37_9GAMM|nr:hypothetical protein [Affinibrenneria salicis]KAA8999034.1 hypothetical protein FJU30_15290 [Affinibrenneria salicis]
MEHHDVDFEQAETIAADKTDYRKRLALIETLRAVPGERSQAILLRMMNTDFVFSVRMAAWQALSGMGVQAKQPVQKKGYLIGPLLKRFLWFCQRNLPWWVW